VKVVQKAVNSFDGAKKHFVIYKCQKNNSFKNLKKRIVCRQLLGGDLMKLSTYIVLVLTILFNQNAFSQSLSLDHYTTEFVDIINQVQLENDTSYTLAETKLNDGCVVFMNKDQFLGENGRVIFDSLTTKASTYPLVLQGQSLAKYCKAYPTMESDQKALVWVLILTMVAQFESSCNIKAKAQGPNGTANGFFQLHLGKEANYVNVCVKNASTSGKLSSQCTLAMLETQMVRQNNELFSPKSYWDVLRPAGRAQKADDIQRALMKSSLCNPITI
jgi:hypothetical protein